jgi:hypothetical protein
VVIIMMNPNSIHFSPYSIIVSLVADE